MGFFNSPKVFLTRRQIQEALYKIKTLDVQQREAVLSAFGKELDDGGVSVEEIKRVTRELREKKLISEIDAEALRSLSNGS